MPRPNTTKEAIERVCREYGLPGELPEQTVTRMVNQFGSIEDAAPKLDMKFHALLRWCNAHVIERETTYVWRGAGELEHA